MFSSQDYLENLEKNILYSKNNKFNIKIKLSFILRGIKEYDLRSQQLLNFLDNVSICGIGDCKILIKKSKTRKQKLKSTELILSKDNVCITGTFSSITDFNNFYILVQDFFYKMNNDILLKMKVSKNTLILSFGKIYKLIDYDYRIRNYILNADKLFFSIKVSLGKFNRQQKKLLINNIKNNFFYFSKTINSEESSFLVENILKYDEDVNNTEIN